MTHEQLADVYYKLAKKGGELDAEHPGFSWRAIIFFYAALHAVDHRLSALRRYPRDHKDRRAWVDNLPELDSVKVDYQFLEGLSQQARYHPDQCPLDQDEFRDARDSAKRILKALGFKTLPAAHPQKRTQLRQRGGFFSGEHAGHPTRAPVVVVGERQEGGAAVGADEPGRPVEAREREPRAAIGVRVDVVGDQLGRLKQPEQPPGPGEGVSGGRGRALLVVVVGEGSEFLQSKSSGGHGAAQPTTVLPRRPAP